ncbi:hypothetical protein [Amphibacillus sediminis]|uniref:hypothetical protein n=1 Tax=Amphibacillus sediminis TaxID=360185 RepID=UPI0008308B67|nr:hypothetical protein [Amphibacillus sediminis]
MRYLTESEYALASRFLFLSMALIVLQKDSAKLADNSTLTIKQPYLDLLTKMIDKALLERQQLRKYMHDQKLKIITLERNNTFTGYLFICQGREEQRNYFNPAIRKKVEVILSELMLNILESPSSSK